MKLSEEMKNVIQNAYALSLVTQNPDGTPHPIIVGSKDCDEENILFGIYKMEITQKNLESNDKAWVTGFIAVENGAPIAYRFCGTAKVQDKSVVFTPDEAQPLL